MVSESFRVRAFEASVEDTELTSWLGSSCDGDCFMAVNRFDIDYSSTGGSNEIKLEVRVDIVAVNSEMIAFFD